MQLRVLPVCACKFQGHPSKKSPYTTHGARAVETFQVEGHRGIGDVQAETRTLLATTHPRRPDGHLADMADHLDIHRHGVLIQQAGEGRNILQIDGPVGMTGHL
jgi:hypothetical protein